MPSLAIYGDSGMGKTMIMQRFSNNHPPSFDPAAGILQTPVLALQMTGRPSERRLFAQLLTAAGAPKSTRCDIVDLEQTTLRVLRTIGVKVLVLGHIVDENGRPRNAPAATPAPVVAGRLTFCQPEPATRGPRHRRRAASRPEGPLRRQRDRRANHQTRCIAACRGSKARIGSSSAPPCLAGRSLGMSRTIVGWPTIPMSSATTDQPVASYAAGLCRPTPRWN